MTSNSVAPAAPTSAPHVSWLKKVGAVIGKILNIVGHEAAPVADTAAKVAEALLPQFAGEIQKADGIVSSIAKEAVIAEAVSNSAAAVTGVDAKLTQVATNIAPALDAWVQANFPGSKQISAASKAGLVSAVVKILNEVQPEDSAAAAPATAAS